MSEFVFATSNPNKVREIALQLPKELSILSLSDIGCTEEVPETQDTIAGNAIQKARYVFDHYHKNCFAEDTGLEVDALDGAPGVYSARYAGAQRRSADNISKLLHELRDHENRSARFRTVFCLIIDGQEHSFEGIAEGHITMDIRGAGGFGYDPVFLPLGHELTFAEMDAAAKNQISHRTKAFKKMVAFLRSS